MHSYAYTVDDRQRHLIEAPEPEVEAVWSSGFTCVSLGDGVRLNVMDFVADEAHLMRGKGPATFCLAVFLDYRGSMSVENGPAMPVDANTMVLFHTPRPAWGENYVAPNTRVRGIAIRFNPSLLETFGMPERSALLPFYPTDCSLHDVLFVSREPSAQVRANVSAMLACRFSGPAQALFLRAKAFEILANVVAEAGSGETSPYCAGIDGLGRRDYDRVIAARRLLETRYHERWTIPLLARTVGINERKLKSGFRQIVGRTIHTYLEEARMDVAAALLSQGDSSVTEAAMAVGYENLSHFAKRFRHRHGVRPSDWRRDGA